MKAAALFVATVLVVPAHAAAQEIASSFEQLSRLQVISEGDQIRITYAFERGGLTYIEAEGNVVGLTDSAITVRFRSIPAGTTDLEINAAGDDREIDIPESRVRQIVRTPEDSLWNGALIGAGVGAGAVALGVAIICANEGGCDLEEAPVGIAPAIAFWGGVGAGIGALVDGLRRSPHELVYLAPGSTVSPFTFAVSPLLSRKQKGLLFTIRW